jgi:pimeloyl-ACP methyl ester carboxylesterase
MPRTPLAPFPRRFKVASKPFTVTTEDDVLLAGSRLGNEDPAIVFCHGFMGQHRKPRVAQFVERLSTRFTVYAFDLRGHGRSGGICTFGDRELLDVDAVLSLARDEGHPRVGTIGASMGGIAVIRHGGLRGGADLVVAVSVPARWQGHRSAAIQRMQRLTTSPYGRQVVRVAGGVRVATWWNEPESPEDVVAKIAPTPLVLVHGRDDHFFDEEEAWRLYRRAGQPKRLLLASRFGHAEDGFTPDFAERISRVIYQEWGLPWRE